MEKFKKMREVVSPDKTRAMQTLKYAATEFAEQHNKQNAGFWTRMKIMASALSVSAFAIIIASFFVFRGPDYIAERFNASTDARSVNTVLASTEDIKNTDPNSDFNDADLLQLINDVE